jgi:hypothetical protein
MDAQSITHDFNTEFCNYIAEGNLRRAMEIFDPNQNYYIDEFSMSSLYWTDRFDIMDWMVDAHNITMETVLRYNTYCPHYMKLLNWMHLYRDKIELKYDENDIDTSASCGFVEHLQWWFDHRTEYPMKYKSAINVASGHGRVNVLNWWYDKYLCGELNFEYTVDALHCAMRNGHMHVVNWWFELRDELEIKCDIYVTKILNLKILNFMLYEQELIPIKLHSLHIDAYHEACQLEVLNFWFDDARRSVYGFEYTHRIINMASNSGTTCVLDWWYDRMLSHQLELKYTTDAIDRCFSDLALVWWSRHSDQLEFKYTSKAFDTALVRNNSSVIEWWLDNSYKHELKFTIDVAQQYVNQQGKFGERVEKLITN